MADNASDYLEQKILNMVFKGTSWTTLSNVFVAIHSASPADTGANEVTGAGYARQSTASADWTSPSVSGTGYATSNVNAISFTIPASFGGSQIVGVSVWDASTAGNCLYSGDLTAPKAVNPSDTFRFDPSNLTITLK